MKDGELPGRDDVLRFWLEECGPTDWYRGGEALDARIRERFEGLWNVARGGGLVLWEGSAQGALALLLLTDQFPRNMFRDEGRAFATDALARSVAGRAVARGFDIATPAPERQFFYLPFEHSESLTDQERAVRLIATRMGDEELLLHARAHRRVIRQFGRFPFRNEALGRQTRAGEQGFLDAGAYGAVVRDLQAEG